MFTRGKVNTMTGNKLAKKLLNAVWEEDLYAAQQAIREGADPSWIINGYPLLIHAVFTRNEAMVTLLIEQGAEQCAEALGFALDHGIGCVVGALAYRGIIPKVYETPELFGPLPHRYAPLDLFS